MALNVKILINLNPVFTFQGLAKELFLSDRKNIILHKSDQFIVASKFAEILVFRTNDFKVFAITDFKFWRAK